MTAPKITPSQSVNTPLEEVERYSPQLTAKRIGIIGGVLIDLILAQVCLALGNVSILGIKPFEFLTQWGYDLQAKAADAYKNSFAIVDARSGAAAGTTSSGSIVSIYNAAAAINSTANTASTTATTAASSASTALSNNVATNSAIYNGFYGAGATGTSTEVLATVTDIKTQLAGGWTVQTITTSGTWTRPWSAGAIPKEFWAICVAGGGGGQGGATGLAGTTWTGGTGGDGGAYVAQQVNPTDIGSTVSVTVGLGGTGGVGGRQNNSVFRQLGDDGGTTSFGSLASAAFSYASSSIATLFGYYDASASAPGTGGNGQHASGTPAATAGASTPLAAGGAAGPSNSSGSDGGNASLTGQTRCGGGGGGGGSSVIVQSSPYRGGGNGGFPGGGGGGGGALAGGGSSYYAGNGGNGANGVVVLLWR